MIKGCFYWDTDEKRYIRITAYNACKIREENPEHYERISKYFFAKYDNEFKQVTPVNRRGAKYHFRVVDKKDIEYNKEFNPMTEEHRIIEEVISELKEIHLKSRNVDFYLKNVKSLGCEYVIKNDSQWVKIDNMIEFEGCNIPGFHDLCRGQLAIEVYHSHRVTPSKIKFLQEQGIACFEIQTASLDFIFNKYCDKKESGIVEEFLSFFRNEEHYLGGRFITLKEEIFDLI